MDEETDKQYNGLHSRRDGHWCPPGCGPYACDGRTMVIESLAIGIRRYLRQRHGPDVIRGMATLPIGHRDRLLVQWLRRGEEPGKPPDPPPGIPEPQTDFEILQVAHKASGCRRFPFLDYSEKSKTIIGYICVESCPLQVRIEGIPVWKALLHAHNWKGTA